MFTVFTGKLIYVPQNKKLDDITLSSSQSHSLPSPRLAPEGPHSGSIFLSPLGAAPALTGHPSHWNASPSGMEQEHLRNVGEKPGE